MSTAAFCSRYLSHYLPARSITSALLLFSASDVAIALDADKRRYWLLNPTPDRLLRELSTDRPDMTESPFTVDAGRIQIETNFYGHSRSNADHEGIVTHSHDYFVTNLRIGLTNWAEFNVLLSPHGAV